jgi:DNA-binding MarR family transcriptional regulator
MDIVSKFTKEITLVNLAIKQFLQCKLREHNIDLTFEMLQVLHCLWTNNGINQQEIANLTAKDKASVTYVLDNLVKRNYVYRQEGEDRRNKIIFLTPEGKNVKKKIQPWIKELNDASRKDISLDKLEELVTVMAKIRKNLSKH